MNEWIAVDDELPRITETGTSLVVLVTDERLIGLAECATHNFKDRYWQSYSPGPDAYHITHWMPLPAPPLYVPPEHKSPHRASDAGNGINKEVVAPDQGSVRNATDSKAATIHALYELYLSKRLLPGVHGQQLGLEQYRITTSGQQLESIMDAIEIIRALPDQKD